MASFTKDVIKNTFMDLLDRMPMSQITVKLLVEECGINRNSFYYHYQDLPSLIEELVKEEADRIIREHPSIESVEAALRAAVDFAAQNRRAILHIYNSVNRDIFERYLWQVCDHVIATYGATALKDQAISAPDRELIGRFCRCACFGLVIDWLDRPMAPDIEAQISRFCQLNRGLVEEMLRRSAGTSEC